MKCNLLLMCWAYSFTGQKFAYNEMKTTLANIFRNFTVNTIMTPNSKESEKSVAKKLTWPCDGVRIQFKRRNLSGWVFKLATNYCYGLMKQPINVDADNDNECDTLFEIQGSLLFRDIKMSREGHKNRTFRALYVSSSVRVSCKLKSRLHHHESIHLDKSLWKLRCDECDYPGKSKDYSNTHKKTHSNDKLHKCVLLAL